MGVNLSTSSRVLSLVSAFVIALTTMTTVAVAPAKASAAAECGGALAFGEIAACPSISDGRHDIFTITTTKANDKLFTMLTRGSGDSPQASITAPDGQEVCVILSDARTCQLGPAGSYKITVHMYFDSDSGNYTLSVQSLRTPSLCTSLANQFFSFASAGFPSNLPLGSSGDCFRFNQPVGSLVRLWSPRANPFGDVQGQILDGQLQPVCQVRHATYCTLNTPGPYRLQMFEYYGNPVSYTLRMSRITNAAGCSPLKPSGFGDPGDTAGTGHLPAQEAIACHRLRMPSAGTVGIRIHNQQNIYWSVYDEAGRLLCEEGYPPARACYLPSEGNYSVITQSQYWDPIDYQIAAPALFRNTGCTAGTGLSWALDAILVHQTSPVQTNCQPFDGNAGDRVMVYRAPVIYNDIVAWLVDSSGEALCTEYTNEDGCVLPATGQYRVISHTLNWDPAVPDATYKMQVRRLSSPEGCPVIQPGAYGAAPAGALGSVRCRILDITTPGRYIAKAFDEHNTQTYGTVYDSAGNRVCEDSSVCEIPAAGRYTMVLNGRAVTSVIENDFHYVTTVLPWMPSGCATVSDTGYLDAPDLGEFTSAGQYLCRQLTSPAGAKVVLLQPTDAPQLSRLNGYVLDSTGAYLCEVPYNMRQISCQLSGTAPFYVVLHEFNSSDPGPFSVAFGRVDGPPACPVLPRGTDGTIVTTGPDRFALCFSIPAEEHAARERFTWRRVSGAGLGAMSVFSSDGLRYCRSSPALDRTFTCTLPPGPVTVIFEAGSTDATYQITHRDGTTP